MTRHPAADVHPEYLPDGRLMFYGVRDGERDTFVMRVAGEARRVGEEIGAASPDGKFIARTRCPHGNCDIYLYRRDGTRLARLTHAPGGDSSPAFSPDGRRIVFVSRRLPPGEAAQGPTVIYVMRVDGSGQRPISPSSYKVHFVEPRFSPDGRFVAYTSSGEDPRYQYENSVVVIQDLRDGSRRSIRHRGDRAPVWQAIR
jgi:TolB protein